MSRPIVVIGASNSRHSINRRLASWAARQTSGYSIEILDLNDYLMPIFGVDLEEKDGIPNAAKRFKTKIHEAKGLVLSLAEHNGSYAVAFKNIVDWASRLEGKLWPNTPMLLLSTSPGGKGGKTVMEAGLAYFPRAGATIAGSFSLPSFKDNFCDALGITDGDLATEFNRQLLSFTNALAKSN